VPADAWSFYLAWSKRLPRRGGSDLAAAVQSKNAPSLGTGSLVTGMVSRNTASWHGLEVFAKSSRIAFALACAGWLAISGRQAYAAAKPFFDLKYEVDPALRVCPEAVEFRAMVAERLKYDPYQGGSALVVEVRARPSEAGLDGSVRWSSPAESGLSERHFSPRSQDCHELMATIAFVVAVQLELMATDSGPEVAPKSTEGGAGKGPDIVGSPAVTPAEVPSGAQTPADTSEPESASAAVAPSSKGSFWTGAGPTVGLGLAPAASVQGRLFLAAEFTRVALEIGAEASLPTTTYQDHGGGFRYQLTLGTLVACARHGSMEVCGLGKLGRLGVRGVAVDRPASATGFVAQVGPRVAYSLALGDHLALQAHVDALLLLTPWTVDVNHVPMWTMPRFAGVAGIDVAVRFR
jgi:hypothetical protein